VTALLLVSALVNAAMCVGMCVLANDNKRLCRMLQVRCNESGCDHPAVDYDWFCEKHMGLTS
jgi:hypothetical protein